jgi:hypothetical protein
MIHEEGTKPSPEVAKVERQETIVRTIKFKTAGREEIIHVGAKIDVDEVSDTVRVNLGDENGSV